MIFAVWDEEYPDDILVKNEKKNYYEQGIKSNPKNNSIICVFHSF